MFLLTLVFRARFYAAEIASAIGYLHSLQIIYRSVSVFVLLLCINSSISNRRHFKIVCLVAWPLNESEACVDLALIETSLLFSYKFLLISMRTASLTYKKQGGFYQNKVNFSLTFI